MALEGALFVDPGALACGSTRGRAGSVTLESPEDDGAAGAGVPGLSLTVTINTENRNGPVLLPPDPTGITPEETKK